MGVSVLGAIGGLVAGAALPSLAACGMPPPPSVRSDLPRNVAPPVDDAQLGQLVADDDAFAVDLYQQVRGQPGNLFFSPYSMSEALAMQYAGAARRHRRPDGHGPRTSPCRRTRSTPR